MAKQETKIAAPTPPQARPVIAVEFDGKLYPSFQKAEGARAKSDLLGLLMPSRSEYHSFDVYSAAREAGRMEAIDAIIRNAERIHGILSRYLDAAKIEMPADPR